ncbi:hypothetical protein [Novosphingobium pokkalii]|uniref:Uncharacterized protein n=1 Tax=Novosphingobium pokkalii TaxID=1770194 RepID=A0ABV7V3N4_9SPHN|nr:hypothetical protein [Novosphingobium pokkalii]GHC93635.1 hypothetical protein GCM10019060_20830 [Novosphingobium pokkalii]
MKKKAAMATILRITGVAAFFMGLLWMLQGLGLVHWPESSFMLDQRPWVWRGLGLALLGIVAVWRAGRKR